MTTTKKTNKIPLKKTVIKIIIKSIAIFFASALSVVGAGSVVGVDVLDSAYMAGLLGLIRVVESLARGFLNDGKLSLTEINAAFRDADKEDRYKW
jgi:hypothetical protein